MPFDVHDRGDLKRSRKKWHKRAAHRRALRDRWAKAAHRARAIVLRRTKQIKALPKPGLRLRAWRQMQILIAEKVTEQGGNNRGARVEEIIRANGGVPGEPWCGDTVAYCYLRAGAKSVTRAWAGVYWLDRLLSRAWHPKRGHVVTYDFPGGTATDHTGLFDRWAPEHGAGYFYAGEGNTGDSGAVSDSRTGGDGVKLKLRHTSQVHSFRRVLR